MKYREFGKTGEKVSELIMGAWVFGGTMWGGGVDDSESLATIEAAIDGGITMIDTAEGYGGGHSEEIVGKALKGKRDKMMIATKVWRDNLTADGIEKSLTASLERLGTDYIDLYQIHWPSHEIPIEETMAKLAEVQKDGRVRWLGVSNFSAEQMDEAMKLARIESLQPPYSLFWRYIEPDLAYCREQDMAVISYSSLAQGLLAGKFTRDLKWNDDDIRAKGFLFMDETYTTACDGVDRMREMAGDKGCTVPQLALAWLLAQPAMTAPIVGARRPDQINGLLGASDVSLSESDVAELTKLGDAVMAKLGDKPMMWDA
jgi:myo-inositol catabolism protein IolS